METAKNSKASKSHSLLTSYKLSIKTLRCWESLQTPRRTTVRMTTRPCLPWSQSMSLPRWDSWWTKESLSTIWFSRRGMSPHRYTARSVGTGSMRLEGVQGAAVAIANLLRERKRLSRAIVLTQGETRGISRGASLWKLRKSLDNFSKIPLLTLDSWVTSSSNSRPSVQIMASS